MTKSANKNSSIINRKLHSRTLTVLAISWVSAIVFGLLLRLLGGDFITQAVSAYVLTPLRTLFLNALKMVVVPVVFFSISASAASMTNIREYGRIGGKTLIYYTVTSFLAILVGFLAYRFLQPGFNLQLDLSAYEYASSGAEDISILDTVTNIIPTSFFGALGGTNMLQIIFIAILTGITASLLDNSRDRWLVSGFLSTCNRFFLKLASIIMKAIPIAVFSAMALLVLYIDLSMIVALVRLVLGMIFGGILMFCIYAILFSAFTKRSPIKFFRKCIPNFISFITLCSTSAVMTQSLDTCVNRLGVSRKVCSFTMPLGSTINMDGAAIYLTISTLFLAAVYKIPIDADAMFKMAITILILSMGAPPISGSGFICLSILVQQLGIPIEGLGILMGIDQIMSMCRTLINGTGDFTGTAIVAATEGEMDLDVFDN